ncbi:MAG: thioredoxin domain-containing protein, partial [Terriglobia bacterium]
MGKRKSSHTRLNQNADGQGSSGRRKPWLARAGWGLAVLALLALVVFTAGDFYSGAETAARPRAPGEPNRLANEASPYLQSAANQPVDWYPFGPEAFRRAQELDRPILLDIGAVWCHWCHVMDRESYENPAIAELINELFVAVKVDRDARPDIDVRYQRAVQALTNQGGWPLTAFLTPAGKVFFGGTYFPPEERQGRPGLKKILPAVANAYQTQKDRILAGADQVLQQLQAYETGLAQPGELNAALLERFVTAVRQEFDPAHGGSKGAPKFPHGGVIELALDRYQASQDRKLLEVARKTLDAMARGGIRDHILGGFHRYATDEFWHIPHFEKMAYVQAELLQAYARGYQVTRDPLYREAAEEIIGYLTRTLSDQAEGGFYATQDADLSLDDDGTYYTWTLEEVERLLTPEEARVMTTRFGIKYAPARHVPSTPNRNVLYLARSVEEIAQELRLPVERVRPLLASGKAKLRTSRLGQKAPFVDKNKFTDWNALLLSAYRHAHDAFGDERVKQFALKTTDFLLARSYRRGGGMYHTVFAGQSLTPGLLADQVYMAQALLDMYELSGRARYLAVARDLMDYTVKNFGDAEQGG